MIFLRIEAQSTYFHLSLFPPEVLIPLASGGTTIQTDLEDYSYLQVFFFFCLNLFCSVLC